MLLILEKRLDCYSNQQIYQAPMVSHRLSGNEEEASSFIFMHLVDKF